MFDFFFFVHYSQRKQQKELTKKWAQWSRLFAEQPFNDVKSVNIYIATLSFLFWRGGGHYSHIGAECTC